MKRINNKDGIIPTLLYATRKDVSLTNLKELKTLKEKNESKIYEADTQIVNDTKERLTEKYEQSLKQKLINLKLFKK